MPRVENKSSKLAKFLSGLDLSVGVGTPAPPLRRQGNQGAVERADARFEWERYQKRMELMHQRAMLDWDQARARVLQTGGHSVIREALEGKVQLGGTPSGVPGFDYEAAFEAIKSLPDIDRGPAQVFLQSKLDQEIATRRYQEAVQLIQQASQPDPVTGRPPILTPETASQMLADMEDAAEEAITPDALIEAIHGEMQGFADQQAAFQMYARTDAQMQELVAQPVPPPGMLISPAEWEQRVAEATRRAEMWRVNWNAVSGTDALQEVASILYAPSDEGIRNQAISMAEKWTEWDMAQTLEERQALVDQAMQLITGRELPAAGGGGGNGGEGGDLGETSDFLDASLRADAMRAEQGTTGGWEEAEGEKGELQGPNVHRPTGRRLWGGGKAMRPVPLGGEPEPAEMADMGPYAEGHQPYQFERTKDVLPEFMQHKNYASAMRELGYDGPMDTFLQSAPAYLRKALKEGKLGDGRKLTAALRRRVQGLLSALAWHDSQAEHQIGVE